MRTSVRHTAASNTRLGASVDVTDARDGQVLIGKRPTANQCDGLFFFQVGARTPLELCLSGVQGLAFDGLSRLSRLAAA